LPKRANLSEFNVESKRRNILRHLNWRAFIEQMAKWELFRSKVV